MKIVCVVIEIIKSILLGLPPLD